MASFASNRRTFRGRGRPTDGNIPNSISQRRRARAARHDNDSLGHSSARAVAAVDGEAAAGSAEAAAQAAQAQSIREAMASHVLGTIGDDKPDTFLSSERTSSSGREARSDRINNTRAGGTPSSSDGDDGCIPADLKDEIDHLRRRMRNVLESIQLSQAIVQPSSWEQNCLNAVRSCAAEWRSIVDFHGKPGDGGERCSNCDCEGNDIERGAQSSTGGEGLAVALLDPASDIGRSTSLEVFGLVQLAMQSGPLAGGKPGYFKRCGGDVARLALAFLRSDPLGSGDLTSTLWFTAAQADAVKKWIGDAEKAVARDKPPSKSMLKLQQRQLKEGRKASSKKGVSRKDGSKGKPVAVMK